MVLADSCPILAHHATDKSDIRQVLSLLDEAEKCIDPAKSYPDPFCMAEFDEGFYFLVRASSIVSLLRLDPTLLDEAFEALDLAQQRTKPQYVRRRASIESHYAHAAFHTGEYLSAIDTALEALELAQSIDSVRHMKRIQRLYENLAQTKIKDSSELRKLKQALTKK